MSELLPCPFCGGEAVFNAYDRLISIGCGKCGYTRGFKGLLTTEPHGKPVSREGAPVVEYYNKNAHKEAIEAWNTRAERTCTIKYSEFYDYENEPFEFDGYWKTDLSCWHTELTIFKPEEGMFCSHCGAKVVNE